MGRKKKKESLVRSVQIPVYFTKDEAKQIRKKANAKILGISPFIRINTIETCGIKTEEES